MSGLARYACALALALLAPSWAHAQAGDGFDYDPSAAEGAHLSWFSNLLLRGDWARDLPQNLPDEQRGMARLRAGLLWLPDDAWEVAAALEASRGSDSARIVRLEHSIAVGDFDRVVLAGGAWLGDHLYGDTSRLLALQAGWRLREGAPHSGGILLSLLAFDELDDLVRGGLARSNRVVGGRFDSDFRLADLQLAYDTRIAGAPLRTRIDLVRNLGADRDRDGARGSVVWGDAREAGALELGFSYQRVQRDAVLAAFNSEDWWFHSAMRGAMPWIGYGIDDTWRVQLALFLERADGRAEDTERALLDLRADW